MASVGPEFPIYKTGNRDHTYLTGLLGRTKEMAKGSVYMQFLLQTKYKTAYFGTGVNKVLK